MDHGAMCMHEKKLGQITWLRTTASHHGVYELGWDLSPQTAAANTQHICSHQALYRACGHQKMAH